MNKATFLFLDAIKQKIDNRGKTPPLSLFGNHMLEVKHIQGDRIYPVLENTKYVSDEVWETWFRQHLLPGDILFSTVGSIGRVCLVPPEPPLCISQNILGFRINELIADGKFFFYYLKSDIFQQEIESRSIETVQKSIKFADLKDIPLFLPPLQEQKSIAHILGTLDDKIELNRKTNETLESMAKALFKSWFVDFDPVMAKAEGRPTGLPAEISDLFPDSFEDSELGEIPSGWKVMELGDCSLHIESGTRPKGGIDKNLAFGIPSIGAESISPIGQFDFSKTKWVDAAFAQSAGRGWILNYDVALYKDGGKPGEFRPRTAFYGDGFPFEKAMVNEHVSPCISKEVRSYQRNHQGAQPMNNETDLRRQISW